MINNLEPLRSQSPKRLAMAVSQSPLVPIVSVRPLTSIQRDKRKPVHGVAQLLVTGKSKLYHVGFATRLGHRHHSCLGLKVPERLPLTVGIPQIGSKLWCQGPTLCSRQRLHKLSCRHRGEKTLHLLPVLLYGSDQNLQFLYQYLHQLRLGSDYMFRDAQLCLAQSLPQLSTALLSQMVLPRKALLPLKAQPTKSL